MFVYYLFLGFIGLTIGSFLNVLVYRLPREINFRKGRSFCPHCKHKIAWYDNIPLVSYIVLGGRCRNCRKAISPTYPIIEALTALIFLLTFYLSGKCDSVQSLFCNLHQNFSFLSLPYFFLIFSSFVVIFFIDLFHQLILDNLSFLIFIVSFFMILFFKNQFVYANLVAGFAAGLFFLFLNLVTKGKGMGLGDSKLGLAAGMILGWPYTIIWLLISFIIGASVGIFLISVGKAKFGKQIPFAPFLVLSFFLTLFWGESLYSLIFWNF